MTKRIDEVADWLRQHPGHHRPTDVAKGIGAPARKTAMSLRYLWERGCIDRLLVQREGYKRIDGIYGTEDGVVREPSITLVNHHRKRNEQARVKKITKVEPPTTKRKQGK